MESGEKQKMIQYSSEKSFSEAITLMKWSEKRDLLALATEDGHVLLHRFEKLERAWNYKALKDFPNAKVSALCWRPDGRVLSVAYHDADPDSEEQNAFFKLLTERGPSDLMEEVALPSAAVDMTWTESEYDTKIDSDISFFPQLPKIGNLDHTTLENLIGPKLNILIVALEDGSVSGFGYGAVPLFNIDIPGDCLSARISAKLDAIFVTARNSEEMLEHICVQTEKLAASHLQVNRFCCYLITTKLCVSYLQNCITEMENCWVDALNPRLTEFGHQLLGMYLWGIQTPELQQFLSQELDLKALLEVGVTMRAKCAQVQRLCVINVQEATEKLFSALHHLATLSTCESAFSILNPFHTEITFSSIGRYVAQLAIKNVELIQLVSDLLVDGVSFAKWLHAQLVKINGENVENNSQISEQSASDEQRIINFITRHIHGDYVSEYFKQKPLTKRPKNSPNRWKKLLEKYNIKSALIYECDENISLRTATDYIRRLLTKLSFRSENGRFGCPTSALSKSLSVVNRITLSSNQTCISSHFSSNSYFTAICTSEDENLIKIFEFDGKEAISKFDFSILEGIKIDAISIYSVDYKTIFLLTITSSLKQESNQRILLLELVCGQPVKILEERPLNSPTHFKSISADSSREVSSILSQSRKVLRSFEIELI